MLCCPLWLRFCHIVTCSGVTGWCKASTGCCSGCYELCNGVYDRNAIAVIVVIILISIHLLARILCICAEILICRQPEIHKINCKYIYIQIQRAVIQGCILIISNSKTRLFTMQLFRRVYVYVDVCVCVTDFQCSQTRDEL